MLKYEASDSINRKLTKKNYPSNPPAGNQWQTGEHIQECSESVISVHDSVFERHVLQYRFDETRMVEFERRYITDEQNMLEIMQCLDATVQIPIELLYDNRQTRQHRRFAVCSLLLVVPFAEGNGMVTYPLACLFTITGCNQTRTRRMFTSQ